MNTEDMKQFLQNFEIEGDKILIQTDLAKNIEFIKNQFKFDILKEITAIDNNNNTTELIYRLFSTSNDEELIISHTVTEHAESISKIFDSAIADENEIYDMFGIKFTGHENLKRLYMSDCWSGNPLKKNYKEDDERLKWND